MESEPTTERCPACGESKPLTGGWGQRFEFAAHGIRSVFSCPDCRTPPFTARLQFAGVPQRECLARGLNEIHRIVPGGLPTGPAAQVVHSISSQIRHQVEEIQVETVGLSTAEKMKISNGLRAVPGARTSGLLDAWDRHITALPAFPSTTRP